MNRQAASPRDASLSACVNSESIPARANFLAPVAITKKSGSRAMRQWVLLAGMTTGLFALAGCAGGSSGVLVTVTGTVSSGGAGSAVPISGATVSIYEAETASAPVIASGVTSATGSFSINVPTDGSGNVYYAIASKGSNIELMALLGNAPLQSVTINELTTVASAYAMAQFLQSDSVIGPQLPLTIATGMAENLVSAATGTPSLIIQLAPNANQTNTWRELGTLANIMASCVQAASGACSSLFSASPTRAGVVPTTTLQAISNIAHNPAANVSTLFALGAATQTYVPFLGSIQGPGSINPLQRLDAWTLAVKFNNTGSPTCPWAGPANPAFDQNGYAWIGNNVVAGTPNSTTCNVVLKPNGQPADGSNNTPTSPIRGGGILGAGYGMMIDTSGSIWMDDFGWGGSAYIPGGAGSPEPAGAISQFSPVGVALSPSVGWVGGTLRPQGMASDFNGNIWIANYGNSAVTVFPKGNPAAAFSYPGGTNVSAFGLAVAADGSVWVGYTGSYTVQKFKLAGTTITPQFSTALALPSGSNPKGVAVDSKGNAWIAAAGTTNKVYAFDSNGNPLAGSPYSGGGMNGPWGVSIDAKDNIWVATFGGYTDQPITKYGVVELCGATVANCPSGSTIGSAISPATGFTLPSAGDQVLLSDGSQVYEDPLNSPPSLPSYKPVMRQTQAKPDMAGNVWVMNNWKPSAFNDVLSTPMDPSANPGGDGIVIFVGLAAPTKAPQIGPAQAP
jgi:hypothetical protein